VREGGVDGKFELNILCIWLTIHWIKFVSINNNKNIAVVLKLIACCRSNLDFDLNKFS
jgi:hypothetical protein